MNLMPFQNFLYSIVDPDEESVKKLHDGLHENVDGQSPETLEESSQELESSENLRQALQDQENKYLLAVADFQNRMKRLEKQMKEQEKYGISKFALEILNIYDNLSRALASLEGQEGGADSVDSIMQGLRMIQSQMAEVLKRFFIEKVPGVGALLDPSYHQVMMTLSPEKENETSETCSEEDGIYVAQVFQEGYRLHDRILRPALVATSFGKAETSKH